MSSVISTVEADADTIHVLHVDDEPDFAELAAKFLRRENERIDVETIESPSEALERLHATRIDCVVSDYDMPGQNGIEFLKAVREDHPDLPFILYTGKGSEEIASDAVSAGVSDYLQKGPGTSQYTLLANRIINLVDQYRSRRSLEETQQKLVRITEKSDHILFMFDSDWTELLYINSAYEDIWDRSVAELEANPRSFLQNIHPEDQDLVEETLERVLEGKAVDAEYRLLTDDEEVRWVYSEAKPIFDEDGTFTRIVGFVRDITDRKEREQKLGELAQYNQEIVANAPVGLFRLDDEMRIVHENERAEEIIGVPEGADGSPALGTDLRDLPSVQGTDVIGALNRLEAGETVSFDTRFESIFGKESYLAGKGIPLSDDGAFGGAIIMVEDISDRVAKEEILDQLKQNVTDVVWLSTPEKDSMEFISDAYEEVWGRPTESLEENPRSFIDAIHPDDRDRVRTAIEKQQRQPDKYEETYRVIRPDGEQRWVHDRSSGVYENGELIRVIGVATDITERKEREQELREQQHFVDSALDTLADIFYVVSPDGETLRWNDFVPEVTGYTDEEIAAMEAWDFFEADDGEVIQAFIEEVLETGEATVEAALVTKDGTAIPYASNGRRLVDTNGELVGVVGIGRDISDRKEREQALEKLHAAARDLMAATTKEEVLATGSETAETVLGLPLNGIHLYDQDEDTLNPVAWTDQSEALLEDIPPSVPIEGSLAGLAYRTGEPGLYSDVREEAETLNPETPMRSELHVPLGEHGVFMAGSTTPDDFDASDAALAQVLAANIESALDRVEREQDLARQQSLLEAQQEAVLDGMVVTDDDRQIISYNDRFVEMWDIPEEIVERGDDDRVVEAASDQYANPDQLQERVDYLYEHPEESSQEEIELADGRVFERYTTPLTAEDGTHYGRLWTFRDISERENRIREVERERNRFEAVFETIPEPTVHVVFEDSEPIIQHVNDAFEAVFGYGPAEARGESVDALIVSADQQAEATDINDSVQETGSVQTEIERETVTGDRPFLFTAQTMRLGEGDSERVEGVGTYVDLTQQQRREKELTRQNERLDEFASMVSHDLRSPLRVAEGHLELALEEPERAPIESALDALARMEDLIEDVLALARKGQPIDETQEVQLAAVVQRCWEMVDNTEAQLEVDGELGFLADPDRVQQLLENLFRNAIDYGGRNVSIAVGVLDSEDGFYVADNGPGIPEEERGKVFESGYSTSEDGTGLGLAIVGEIVEAHGWDIDITVSDAGGARFEITGVESVAG